MDLPGEDDGAARSSRPVSKQDWRRRILAERSTVTPPTHAAEAAALAVAAKTLAASQDTVCAYVPIGSEPGALDMLDALAESYARVLLPVTRPESPLSWGEFTGVENLQRASLGLREPTGTVLPPAEIAAASVVLIPALAVDRRGVRLGRGAGFYDRSLALAAPQARLIAVVRDTELVDELPEEAHDRRMGWSLTPSGGLTALGREFPAQ